MVEFKSANLNTGNVLKITEGDTSSVSCDIYYYKILSIEGISIQECAKYYGKIL